jgi:cyanophycin synthetase
VSAQRLAARLGDGYGDMWARAAHDVGADVIELGDGFLELTRGAARTRVWGHWVAVDDIVTRRLALHKAVVHRLMAGAGLPVPEQLHFDARDLAAALAFLDGADGACVVKPVDGAGGTGVTGGVRSPRELQRAVVRAGRRSRSLVIERQVAGDVYRLLLLDGELLDVIRRDPPRVTGDGRSTVAQLIAAENRRRLAGATARGARPWLLTIDLDCVFTLQRAGAGLASVLPPGARVAVKTAVNSNGPDDNESVFGEVSEALVAQAALAAAVTGVRLAGVDVITPDPATALDRSGGVVLEVNATPGLGYHDAVRNPGRTPAVAAQILQRLLEGPTTEIDDQSTTPRRENGDGRQAKVSGDAAWAGVPDPGDLGAA